jgi:hypothetical protein
MASDGLKASQVSVRPFTIKWNPLYPRRDQLAGGIVAGYPTQMFRGRELVVANGPIARITDGATMPTALAGGASGGPFFVGNELVGIYAKTDPLDGGFLGKMMLFRSDKHQALFNQAIERARTQL